MIDDRLRLKDGRDLGIAIVGPSDGIPVFHFHSRGLCRLEVQFLARSANRLGVRVIGIDRPGIGRSTPSPAFRVMDWPVDIAEAADLLGLERFAVQGLSAGAAYALACAFEIPHRLSGCGLVSSISPGSLVRQSAPLWKRVTSWTLEHHPLLARSLIGPFLPDSPDQIDKIVARLESVASEPDRRLLRTPEFRAAFELALAEGLRQGKGGNLDDIVRQIEPWGFALDAVAFKSIHLWHGAEDQIVPIAAAKALEGSLTYGVLTVCEGEGHLSTFVNRSDEILTWLSSAP